MVSSNLSFAMETNLIFAIFLIIAPSGNWAQDANPYHHTETLDKNGKYVLQWLVDWEDTRIYFNVTVNTKGYVGFGLSKKGKMLGADIVIGGVLPSGDYYFSDRHAIGNQVPVLDTKEDWNLHEAWERDNLTFLSFSRKFDTCDEDHDLIINQDVTGLLWAYGETDDEVLYHYQNRGVVYAYLLDPDLSPGELKRTQNIGIDGSRFGEWNVWKIGGQQIVPSADTTYMCSIHKTPQSITKKQHVVGLRSVLPTEVDKRYVHHFLLHRCTPPPNQNAERIFQNLLQVKEPCYILKNPTGRIPTNYCTELMHVWAVGSKGVFFPEHVGLPLYPNEYLMLQIHYNNPELVPNQLVSHTLELFYTGKLREHDAGILGVGHEEPSPVSIMIPPNSIEHEINGHCATDCLRSMLPATGIKFFAAFLHTHTTGSTTRLRHFRGNQELAWMYSDNNYNFDYQQIHVLSEERHVSADDMLLIRCTHTNTHRPGNVTIGGFSSSHEMCSSILWYYPKISGRGLCRSEIRNEEYLKFVRIYNTTWSDADVEAVVTSPRANAGLLVSQVGNERIKWTIKNRRRIQDYHKNMEHITSCPEVNGPAYEFESVIPRGAKSYQEPSACGL